MSFNPFYDYTVEQCDAGIADIRERMLVGAAKVAQAGSGGMDMYSPDVDLANLQHLANRRAFLLGIKPPTRARLRAFVVNPIGYRNACRPL